MESFLSFYVCPRNPCEWMSDEPGECPKHGSALAHATYKLCLLPTERPVPARLVPHGLKALERIWHRVGR